VVRPLLQGRPQQRRQLRGPERRPAGTVVVVQGPDSRILLEGSGPVVDSLAADAQQVGDVADLLAFIEGEESHGTAIAA